MNAQGSFFTRWLAAGEQAECDAACGRLELALRRGDIDDPEFWPWIAVYQQRWTALEAKGGD